MLASGITKSILPTKTGFANNPLRVDDVGNLFTNEETSPLIAAAEGSLFVGRVAPAVSGTGVASGIVVTFVDTTPTIALVNGEAAGGKTIIPLYIRGRCTAPGASSTSAEITIQADNTTRTITGGTALAINNVNPGATVPASLATLTVGALTAAAAGARKRNVGSAVLKIAASPLWIVQDVVLITFGAQPTFVTQASVVASDSAAPVVCAHVPMPATAIPPGGSLIGIIACIANAVTPPSFEWEVGWIERNFG